MQPPPDRIGGSFAPPLSPETLARYRKLAEEAPPRVRSAMHKLCDAVAKFHDLRLSPLKTQKAVGNGTPHPSGRHTVVPLPPEAVAALIDHLPWDDELNVTFPAAFDALCLPEVAAYAEKAARWRAAGGEDTKPLAEGTELRDAAFHLLWFARELQLRRYPMTTDQM